MFRIPLSSVLSTLLVAQVPTPGPIRPQEAPKPKEDVVLAKLGKSVIRQSDFDNFVRLVFNDAQRQQIAAQPAILEKVRAGYLDSLVMSAKAKKDGLEKLPDVRKQLEFAEVRTLATALVEHTKDDLKKRSEATDQDLKDYYDKNLSQFQTKGSFNARHILIATKPAQGGEKGLSDEEALAKAAKVQAELQAGKPWQEVAKQYSDDPGSKENGGLYENIAYGRFVPQFDEAVRKQEIGKPGAPVKSTFGYHIIQVEKRIEPETQAFEAVKEQIRPRAAAAKQEEARKGLLEAWRKEVGFVEVPAAPKPDMKAPVPAPAH